MPGIQDRPIGRIRTTKRRGVAPNVSSKTKTITATKQPKQKALDTGGNYGCFRDEAERDDWYRRMTEMEKSAFQAGISAQRITREQAAHWRKTGQWITDADCGSEPGLSAIKNSSEISATPQRF